MLLLSVQTQYGRNRQYRRKHDSHTHKKLPATVVSLLDAASPNKITGAFVVAITEVFFDALPEPQL
jgi:hypothetical protein